MADLTQKVRYTVEVDASALTALKGMLDAAIASLAGFDAAVKKMGASAKATDSAFLKLTDRLGKLDGVAGTTMGQFKSLSHAQDMQIGVVNKLAGSVAELAAMYKNVAGASKGAQSAINSETAAIKENAAASNTAAKEQTNNGMGFLKLFGKFQAMKWIVKEAFESISDGAKAVNLDQVLGHQIENYSKILDDAKAKTAGMVSTVELQKSMALMSSFGIDMNRFAESMELVQKMAIRTGQSAEFLTESFSKGISRLSPKILDNLGIQISLKSANEAYAASVGKATTELSKAEQTTAVLNETMKELKKNTEGVSLSGLAGKVAALETRVKNLWDTVKMAGAKAVGAIDEAFESASSSVATVVGETEGVLADLQKSLDKQTDPGKIARTKEQILDLQDALAALKVFAADENLAQMFGNGGVLGTTAGQVFKGITGSGKELNDVMALIRGGVKGLDLDFETLAGQASFKLFGNMRAQAKEAFQSIHDQFGEAISPEGYDNLFKAFETKAEETARAMLIMAKARGLAASGGVGNGARDLFEQVMLLKDMRVGWGAISINAQKYAQTLIDNTAQSKALNAQFEQQLLDLDDAAQLHKENKELSEGQTLVQVGYNAAKEREAELETEIKKKFDELQKARADGRGQEEAAALTILQTRMKDVEIEADGWRSTLANQDLYFKTFERGSKAMREAEIAKLNAQVLQLQTLAAQAVLMQVMITMGGAYEMFGAANAGKIDMVAISQQIADAENKAKRIAGMTTPRKGPEEKKPKEEDWGFTDNKFNDKAYLDKLDEFESKRSALMQMRGPLSMFGGGHVDRKGYEEAQTQLLELKKIFDEGKDTFGSIFEKKSFVDDIERLEQAMAPLNERFNTLAEIGKSFGQVGDALQTVIGGLDGLVGSNYASMIGDLTASLSGMAEATGKGADADTLMTAAIPVMRSFTKNLVADKRVQAGIEGAMQAAAAWASAASGNVPGAIAHGISAAMYGAIALKIFRVPKGKAATDKPDNKNHESNEKRRDIHINISGPIAITEAERGVMIRDAMAAATREGL